MKNIEFEVTDTHIVVKIDRKFKEWMSGSGKSLMIASTEGNEKIDGTPYIIGVNCYRKKD